jgi:alpha-L-fucosidase 2
MLRSKHKIIHRGILAAALALSGFVPAAELSRAYMFGEPVSEDAPQPSPAALALWYRRPATRWVEALPLGNGRLGAMVYGGIDADIIQLNEDTLWSGEPRDIQNREAIKYLPKVRRLLLEGKNAEANALVDLAFLGPWNESYVPLGDLLLTFKAIGTVGDYRRELDLASGVARVTYRLESVRFTREIFVSAPDQVIVMRCTADRPGQIFLDASLRSPLRGTRSTRGNDVIFAGRCPTHVDPNYLGEMPNPIVYDDDPAGKGMRFQIQLRPRAEGGTTTVENGIITVEDADAVTLMLAAATSYNGFDKSPSAQGKDPARPCDQHLEAAAAKSPAQLLEAHRADHRRLFERVEIDLGTTAAARLPTDERVRAYGPGKDPGLIALYFQFGRYLLIAGSRPGTQPANLQGIWNKDLRPAWSSNWTLNCNAQINYWPAEVCNLSECHLPLFDLIEELKVDGARTAKNMYGARGWMAHHNTDLWRTATPVGGSALWAIFQTGGA